MNRAEFCFVVLFAASTLIENPGLAQESRLQTFEWMLGSWQQDGKPLDGKSMIEQWTKVSPRTFEGSDYTANNGIGQPSETLRLVEMSGDIFYIAKVGHNPRPVAFKLVPTDDRSARFENPDHDFPTRITYRREGDSEMTVTVEGAEEGRGFQLRFRRIVDQP